MPLRQGGAAGLPWFQCLRCAGRRGGNPCGFTGANRLERFMPRQCWRPKAPQGQPPRHPSFHMVGGPSPSCVHPLDKPGMKLTAPTKGRRACPPSESEPRKSPWAPSIPLTQGRNPPHTMQGRRTGAPWGAFGRQHPTRQDTTSPSARKATGGTRAAASHTEAEPQAPPSKTPRHKDRTPPLQGYPPPTA